MPLADQLGAFEELQEQGKVRHIGVSEVSVEELQAAREITEIVSVQNLYNLTNRKSQDVLDYADAPRASPSSRGSRSPPVTWPRPTARSPRSREELDATPSQVALAWLLQKSPVILPIPGTKSVEHLTENMGAAADPPPRTWPAWTPWPDRRSAAGSDRLLRPTVRDAASDELEQPLQPLRRRRQPAPRPNGW